MEYNFYDFVGKAYDHIKKAGYIKNITSKHIVDNYDSLPSAPAKDVEEFINWLDSRNKYSDYWTNVLAIKTAKIIKERDLNTICSAINLYFKDLNNKLESSLSNYVGNVGDKITITVKDLKHLSSSYYGYGYSANVYDLWRIVGTDNNIYIWGTSAEFDKGDTINAVVKAHKEFNGEKQTVITRGKVINKTIKELPDNDSTKIGNLLKDIY